VLVTKVLWIGDAGATTGLGRVTHEIAGGLVRKYGHDISVLGLNYSGDYSEATEGLKVYRADRWVSNDVFGVRRVAELMALVEPEVTVIVHDPAVVWQYLFSNNQDPEQKLLERPILAYCPIDGYDYPSDWLELLPTVVSLVAMSKFGQQTFKPSALVYHGIDTDSFYPVSDEHPIEVEGENGPVPMGSKEECKEALGFDPNKFLILRVDTNTGRKDYAATIKVVAPFLEKHRDVAMHLHAPSNPQTPGVNIPWMLNRYDLLDGQVTTSTIADPNNGWPENKLLILYNAADLFISTSRGEGFGLTLAESLACGVPVIAQNVSAIPEVVGPGGVLIDSDRRTTVVAGQDLCLPDIEAFADALERVYTNEVWRTELGVKGRKHVTESFSGWGSAVDSFHDFIEALAARWRASQEV
jgi:glycosyltransferase involved in cell wall biosynthesis